ncbi:MAG: hypothetical protein ACKVOS_02290 [Sphingorhabdus sp.]|uniref:hypothetical protein n=1 Tax=Sphingorhabdus sp. TaxID=1902408 RepID=UPI0038FCA6D6
MSKARGRLFFQRLARALRTQDWVAAGIEFTLVVLGVFLGFQLTQWNDDRQSRAREVSLMLNVARDLRDDMTEMDDNIRNASSRMASLDHLLRLSGGWNPPAEFPSSRFIMKVEQAPPFKPNSGYTFGIETFVLATYDGSRFAYNALINADGPNLVRDHARLSEIQKYYASVDQLLTFERGLAESRFRVLDSMQVEGLSAVDGASFERVALILGRSPALRAAIENHWFYTNRQVIVTRSLRTDAAKLVNRIEVEYQR